MTDHVTDRLYLAGRVLRYATWPSIHKQSVGEHSAAIYNIYLQLFGMPTAEVALYIINHDSSELSVGDPPFPLKANNPDLKTAYDRLEPEAEARMGLVMPELDPADRVRMKVCDLLEMMCFGLVEREMGNMLATPIVWRTREAAERLAHDKLPPHEHADVIVFAEKLITQHLNRMEELARLQ